MINVGDKIVIKSGKHKGHEGEISWTNIASTEFEALVKDKRGKEYLLENLKLKDFNYK